MKYGFDHRLDGWARSYALTCSLTLAGLASATYGFLRVNSTVHSIPYLSLNIAKQVPQGLSAIGISTVPPAESPVENPVCFFFAFCSNCDLRSIFVLVYSSHAFRDIICDQDIVA